MRLWHYKLIPVLPRKQLLAQWRECCCIAKNIAINGTPNHILVNKVLEYPTIHFVSYTNKILDEMYKRSYKVNEGSYLKFCDNMNKGQEYFFDPYGMNIANGQLFPDWHNDRYLKQCYYNLQEKYDCGGLTDEEMELIDFCLNREEIMYDKTIDFNKITGNCRKEEKKTSEYDSEINKDLGILGC